jgi:hypothetical protein
MYQSARVDEEVRVTTPNTSDLFSGNHPNPVRIEPHVTHADPLDRARPHATRSSAASFAIRARSGGRP